MSDKFSNLDDPPQIERERLQELFKQAPGFICVLNGPRHVYELANDAYYQLAGHREIRGLALSEVPPEVVSQGYLDKLDRVYQSGEPFVGRALPIQLQRVANGQLEQRYIDLIYQPLFDSDRSVTGIFVQGNDVTDVHMLTQQITYQAAHDGELRHRMKNLLAVTQSIARQTTTKGRTADEYRDDFLSRFSALVEAQDLAFSGQDQTSLTELVERILAPYMGNPQAIIIEPSLAIELSPRTIMSLSLVIHELATNAAKYGALSVSGGQVRIGWQVEKENNHLHLSWLENGGPSVTPPATVGYGTKLIESAVTYTLEGSVELTYATEGLWAEIAIPLGGAALPG